MTDKSFARFPKFNCRAVLNIALLLLILLSPVIKNRAEISDYQSRSDAGIFRFEERRGGGFLSFLFSPENTITVTTTAQTGSGCTLANAIHAANTNQPVGGCAAGSASGPDTIILPAGTYTLTAIDNTETNYGTSNGLPIVNSPISIQGAGADSTVIERSAAAGTPEFRFIQLGASGHLTLTGITFRNGKTTAFGAGAIFPFNTLTVNNCRFENNSTGAGSTGGAIGSGFGYNLIVNNSTFTGNASGGGGGAIGAASGLTITNSTFTDNSATALGGAISMAHASTASITASTFTNNTVTGEGAGGVVNGSTVNVSNSIFNGNSAPFNNSNGRGGAIYALYITVDKSAFINNTAGGSGGGIANVPTGGAFVTVSNSTFSGNTANYGGGINGADTTIENSTISGNFARESGGGVIFNGGNSSLSLNNVTITNNTADSDNNGSGRGGGLFHTYSFGTAQAMNIRNSIIAGNISANTPDCGTEFGHAMLSQGYNLIGNDTGCNFTAAAGDIVGTAAQPVNPLLGALADNGGATRTHALLPNSPAIDAANPNAPDGSGGNCLPNDQRGGVRPGDGDENGTPRCDIGAFEIIPPVPTSLAFTVQPSSTVAGQTITPAVEVAVLDQFGAVFTGATNAVTIALGNNPGGGGTLNGTLTRNAVNGRATFDDLSLTRAANGYTLTAAAASLTSAASGSFNISADIPAQLVFTAQPVNTEALATMPPVRVAVTDQFGNTAADATSAVTLSLNDTSDRLRGTLTRNAAGGIATFNDLSITQPASEYRIQASSDGLAQVLSNPFDVTRPLFVVTKTADTDDGVCNSDCSLREAIRVTEQMAGADTIHFNIPGTSPFVITMNSALPVMHDPVTIDGTTQPGFTTSPIVGIHYTVTSGPVFAINGGNSLIKGLQFTRFQEPPDSHGIIRLNSHHNRVQGNFIGVDFSGNNSAGTAMTGITILGSQNVIGGSTPAERNVISGNGEAIFVGGVSSTAGNRISGNFIGTNAAGTAAIPNQRGITIFSNATTIGGLTAGEGNVISGNSDSSLFINGTSNRVQGNYIGRNAGNTGNIGNGRGVEVRGGANIIGGTEAGAGNIIAGNGSHGIRVIARGTSFFRDMIRGNSIYDNERLGIALTEEADTYLPTPNDPGDNDDGPNNRQNYPVINSADLSGGNLTLQGSLNSHPNRQFVLEFFSNTACDASGYGEGETPIGTTAVSTGASGIVDFTVTLPPVGDGSFITATATEFLSGVNATSEFSQCRQAVSDYFLISGRLTDSGNAPLANTLVQLTGTRSSSTTTDSNGNYSFDNLPDGIYTVTPVSALYEFNPPSRTFTNPSGDQTNQDFVGTRARYRVMGVVNTDCNGAAQALGQVELTVSGGVNESGQTDASGQALFALPPAGNYVLTPSFGNYTFNPPSVTLPNPLTGDLTIEFSAQAPVPLCSRLVTGEVNYIKALNADGSAFAELQAGGTNASEPDLSRDGTRLTFVESGQIYVADFDGSSRVQLTSGNAEKRLPRLSPDKTRIVYQSRAGGGTPRLSLYNLTDNTITTINTNPQSTDQDLEPSWSPDGTKIVFHRVHRPGGVTAHNIFTINADGTNPTQLTNFSGADAADKYAYPDWSPDGTKIVFMSHLGVTRSIVVMNADGTNPTPVYSSADSVLALSHPRWSPDGSKIVFVEPFSTGPTSFYRRLVVINADGSGRIELPEGLFSGLAWAAQPQEQTPAGKNVPVQSGGVSLNFAGVSTDGQTTVNPIPAYSAGSLPGGFVLSGLAYEITTTAAYTAPVTVCFTVPGNIGQTQTQFNALKLMHNENGVLVDRTTSRDFVERQICGAVDSLSPFALAEQIDIAKPKISGLVLDSNGNPLSGARMLLTGAETKETKTDTDGTFSFVNLTTGENYSVQPKQLGYVFNAYSQDFVNLAGGQTIVFTGTAGSFSISGRVTNGNGTGIADVAIQLNNGTLGETMTDANGDYTFAGLPADGSYTVRPFNGVNNFLPLETTINPLLSNVGNVDFTPLAPTAANVSVGGRAMTAGGLGISRALVTLTEADGTVRTVSTGGFGYYKFDGIQAGQTVIISIASKRFVFPQPTQIVNVSDHITEANFLAEP